MKFGSNFWQKIWMAAALFNFIMGVPIALAPAWTFAVAYGPSGVSADPMALRLWRDFGLLVILIGVGYYIVSRDITKNRGLVYLGIVAKLFDVVVLTYRFEAGLANPIVLIPAAIDGIFVILFILFLVQTRSVPVISGPQTDPQGL